MNEMQFVTDINYSWSIIINTEFLALFCHVFICVSKTIHILSQYMIVNLVHEGHL